MTNAELQLYSFFRSTSSARVRTAARLKGIPLSFTYVDLRRGEQFGEEYAQINPNRTVPVLTVTCQGHHGQGSFSIRQSVAILEFFEEVFPDPIPLLPRVSDPVARAHVRELVNVVACDIQPPTNQKILKRIRSQGGNLDEWAKQIMTEGLTAFENMAAPLAGEYSYGDMLSLADVVLAPAVENAVRYGVDLNKLPTVDRVYNRIRHLDAFKSGDWKHQGDTPEDERLE